MSMKYASKWRNTVCGFTLIRLLGIVAIFAVLAAIFFPVFQGMRPLPNGAVQDGSGKPIPGAILRFRDQMGRVIATITSDGNGSFRRGDLDSLSHDTIDGFGLMRMGRRTGAGTLYTFTPLGTHIATFRDKAGKPVPSLAVFLTPIYYAWHRGCDEPFESVSDKSGVVQIPSIPVGGRFGFLSQDPNYVVKRVQTTVAGNTIRYTVTVTTPGTITGCLRDENGRPLRGYKAFATVSPDLNHFDRWYADSLVTGTNGRFRITNLRPRTYYVSAAPARGYHAVSLAQRVLIAPTQTVEVSLQRDSPEQDPHAL